MKAAQKALLNYITQNYAGSTNKFARETRLDQSDLSKLLRGVRKSITVEYAARIEKATEGQVPLALWAGRK